MKWTNSQQEAINALGKNILVSASAGAGKTAVLTERLAKRIIQDKVRVDQILAMTFTEAAAAEMKSRLYTRLNNQDRSVLSEDTRIFLEEQIQSLASANVSTIDSFCLSVIKEYYYMIQLNPELTRTIFTNEETVYMEGLAWDHTIEYYLNEHRDEFQKLVTYFGKNANDYRELKDTVLIISKKAAETKDPDAWFRKAYAFYQPIHSLSQMPDELAYWFFEAYRCRLQAFEETLDSIIEETKKLSEVHPQLENLNVLRDLNTRKTKVAGAYKCIENRNYHEMESAFHSIIITPLAMRIPGECEYKEQKDRLNKAEDKLLEDLYEQSDLLKPDLQEIARILLDLASLFSEAYRQEKINHHGMDFTDVEAWAYRILIAEDFRVAKIYRNRFKEILVDEFQDTNELQNEIVDLLSNGTNVFRVGDVKQSIYRFRGAKPQIMTRLAAIEDDKNHVIHLANNFRSQKSIVEFSNQLFAQLMNIEGLDQKYEREDFVTIGNDSQEDHGQLPVEFHYVITEKPDNEEDTPDQPCRFSSDRAHYIAQKILEMKQTTQFSKWSDYCVLVRSHAIKDDLRQAFKEANIPYSMNTKGGFYSSRPIQDLVQFLKLVANESDDIACTTVLSSSLYQMSFTDLARIRMQDRKNPLIRTLNPSHPVHNDIEAVRLLVQQQGIYEAVSYILTINSYYYSHCTLQDQTNIDLFLDQIHTYEQLHGTDLYAYLHYLSMVQEADAPEAICASGTDDVVKVMTIHQSKGLQFPVVFYWSNSLTKIQGLNLPFTDSVLGIALQHHIAPYGRKYPSYQWIAMEHKYTMEEHAELIRLLYVALTRASKKMILVDSGKEVKDYGPVGLPLVISCKGMTSLILAASPRLHTPYIFREVPAAFHIGKADQQKQTEIQPQCYYNIPKQETGIVSPSSLEYHRIPKLNLKNPVKETQRGTDMHKAVELLPNTPWTAEEIKEVMPSLNNTDIRQLLALSNQPLFQKLQKLDVHKELSFLVEQDNVLTHGFMDYMAKDDTNVWLVDFKSDRGVTAEELKERYQVQIQAYMKALRILYPHHSIEGYLYSFTLQAFLSIKP